MTPQSVSFVRLRLSPQTDRNRLKLSKPLNNKEPERQKLTQKLYCYVDETGQDTRGKLFIVVVIVIEKEKETLAAELEKMEKQSGKHKRKWAKSKEVMRDKYLNMALLLKELKNKIYYQVFEETKSYQDLTNLVIVKAINRYIEKQEINLYEATILIDGLRKTQVHKESKALRDLGLKINKVKGLRDESDPIMRLTDTMAGVVRKAEQGNQKFKDITKEISEKNIINKLN